MTKYFPIKPIYLALLVILCFLAIFHTSGLTIVLLSTCLLSLFLQYDKKQIGQVLIILACFSGYFLWLNNHDNHMSLSEPKSLTNISPIPDTITVDGDLLSFRGYSGERCYQAYYKLKSQEEKTFFEHLNKQAQLTVDAEPSTPESQRNFNGFDYQAYLKTQDIYRIAKIEEIKAIASENVSSPFGSLHLLRRKWLVFIQKHFPSPMKHYMTGLLLGYLGKEFDEMSDLYSHLGIIHLFALSGMQVGFFLKAFRQSLLRLGITQETVDWLQLPFSFFYAGITGFSISVVRSLLQALFQKLNIKGLDNLACVLLTLLMVCPQKVMTAGGILSFTYAFLLSAISFDHLDKLKANLFQTFTLTIGVLPVLTWYFASFQPISIILTAFFSLIFDSFMLPVLSIIFLISPFVIIDHINPLFLWLESLIKSIASWTGQGMIFGMPSPILLLFLIVSLGLLADHFKNKKMTTYLLLSSLIFFLVKHPIENEVTIVDIGQGDSIFIRDMTGKNLLIDVGGRVSFGAKEKWQERQQDTNATRTLIPYLKSRGVSKIDNLLLTHTDTDHIGDLEAVAEEFKIKTILVSPGSLTDKDFVKRLRALNIPVKTIQSKDAIPIMGTKLHVLYPMTVGDGSNDDSLVLYGKLLNKTFLFTGDLEENGEKTLIKTYPNLKVDVLKAGHHGSIGSSLPEFLDHIKPELSLISAGKNNRYQHPHQETLERFIERGIAIYRTDQQGAIRFRGTQSWQIETVRNDMAE